MSITHELAKLDEAPESIFPHIDIIMANWTNINIFIQTEPLTAKDILYLLLYELRTKRRISIIHRLFTRYNSAKKAAEWVALLGEYRLEKYL